MTINDKINFIEDYKRAENASTGSKYDSNANVSCKNIATLQCELGKKDIIDLNRRITSDYLKKLYPNEDIAKMYFDDLSNHIIYRHDETSLMPYCCSISLYPFLLNGLKELGGSSDVPKHADSFIGGLINLVFLVAGQFAGAVAIPEFLTYLDYFLRKDYGEDYTDKLDTVIESFGKRKATLRTKIEDLFQQFVYSVNQPAGARNYQSPFTNIAYFDKYYFESIFKGFVFPDGDKPKWTTTKELQKMFMLWFNEERNHAILTFPVETANVLVKDGKYADEEMATFFAHAWSLGHSFFMYQSDSVDSLSSCCRLRNGVEDNTFSYTLGAGGIETGSKCVITLNLNRIGQNWDREGRKVSISEYIKPIVKRVHKYLKAWNAKLWDDFNADILTVYKAGFIDLDKQYLTIGINGFVELAEYLGYSISRKDKRYAQLAKDILETIKSLNNEDREEHVKFNTEFVPAENLGAKNLHWDEEDGYWTPNRPCYNSYFYVVEDKNTSVIDKFYLQGRDFTGCLDGGSALHNNLDEILTEKQYRHLMDVAVKAGCPYFTYNVPMTICNDCGHIDKHMLHKCPKCGSENLDYATRIIGYLKRVSSFSKIRQEEAKERAYESLK